MKGAKGHILQLHLQEMSKTGKSTEKVNQWLLGARSRVEYAETAKQHKVSFRGDENMQNY